MIEDPLRPAPERPYAPELSDLFIVANWPEPE